jgi:hypothetical protein
MRVRRWAALVSAALLGACGAGTSSGSKGGSKDPGTSPPPATAAAPPAGSGAARPPPVPSQPARYDVVHVDTEHRFLAVGTDGTGYGLDLSTDPSCLYASRDGRSWTERAAHGPGAFLVMTALRSGTLLADTLQGGDHVLSRSDDGGRSWTSVLDLRAYRLLTPHNVGELAGEVLLVEYQSFSPDPQPIRLWASRDDGRTWAVRATFTAFRHGHGLLADGATGTLWLFMGDRTGGTLVSHDGGRTATLVRAPLEGGVLVDGVAVPGGILAGHDTLYQPLYPHVISLSPAGAYVEHAALPGPSYSFHPASGGGYLIGAAREPGGDVYAPGDVSAHLLSSPDGVHIEEVLAYARSDPGDTARADVYFELPTGEAVVDVRNCAGFGKGGVGYVLLRRAP